MIAFPSLLNANGNSVEPIAAALAERVRGNGTVDEGEDCDDENRLNGDCCSSTCQFETGSCDDGLFRNGTNTCSGGTCKHTGDPCPGPDIDFNCSESCNAIADNCTEDDPNGTSEKEIAGDLTNLMQR